MSDQTIPGLPAATGVNGAEQFWAVQSGVDVRLTTQQIVDFVATGTDTTAVITANLNLNVGVYYSLRSSLGTFTGTLPLLSSVAEGTFLEITDIDNDAGVNNFTVHTAGSDTITIYGTSAATFVINLSNTITRVIAGNGSWRAIMYAG